MTKSTNTHFEGTDIPSLLERPEGINVLLSVTHFPLTYTNSKDHRDDKPSFICKSIWLLITWQQREAGFFALCGNLKPWSLWGVKSLDWHHLKASVRWDLPDFYCLKVIGSHLKHCWSSFFSLGCKVHSYKSFLWQNRLPSHYMCLLFRKNYTIFMMRSDWAPNLRQLHSMQRNFVTSVRTENKD